MEGNPLHGCSDSASFPPQRAGLHSTGRKPCARCRGGSRPSTEGREITVRLLSTESRSRFRLRCPTRISRRIAARATCLKPRSRSSAAISSAPTGTSKRASRSLSAFFGSSARGALPAKRATHITATNARIATITGTSTKAVRLRWPGSVPNCNGKNGECSGRQPYSHTSTCSPAGSAARFAGTSTNPSASTTVLSFDAPPLGNGSAKPSARIRTRT